MKKEYDLSKGDRGKFYRPEVELNIPVYLEPDAAEAVRERAKTIDASIGAVVNERQGHPLQVPNAQAEGFVVGGHATARSAFAAIVCGESA